MEIPQAADMLEVIDYTLGIARMLRVQRKALRMYADHDNWLYEHGRADIQGLFALAGNGWEIAEQALSSANAPQSEDAPPAGGDQ